MKKLELFAWVGEDEFGSGEVGLKQALVPAGMVPLVATTLEKINRPYLQEAMMLQSAKYGKPIRLVRFEMAEVVQEIKP